MRVKTGIAAALIMATVTPAIAQTDAPASSGNGKLIQGGRSADPDLGRSDSLSTKLDKSNGVIAPNENVDPGMRVPAPVPQPNSTPVIPPSATGGNSAK